MFSQFPHFNTEYGIGLNADCFDVFTLIPDQSVDLILCDLPYGTTACKWDFKLDKEKRSK